MTKSETPTLARVLTDAGTFRDSPFTVIDVGCSGGLIDIAGEFVPDLRAVGFDPLTTEVQRLQSLESRPGVEFEAALVGAGEAYIGVPRETPNVFDRSSAALYSRLHGFDYAREYFNAGEEIQITDRRIRLDEWLGDRPDWRLDFLKVDTDGADLDVLLSLGERLAEPLAIYIEVSFDGDPGPSHNVFSNIFDLLTGVGFRLFALPATKYSRGAFPQPFEWEMPAQTVRGQIMAADALFCRDLAVEGSDEPHRLLKLASIFDLMDLQDCAEELLGAHAKKVRSATSATEDDIARALAGRTPLGMTPAESRRAFEETPAVFFPTRTAGGDLVPAGASSHATPMGVSLDGAPLLIGTSAGRHYACLGEGWSHPEMQGAWTASPHAWLVIQFAETIPAGAILTLGGWALTGPSTDIPAAVAMNGVLLERDRTTPEGSIAFRLPSEIKAGVVNLTIYAWPLAQPSALGDSDDTRWLGFWLESVAIVSVTSTRGSG